MIGEPLSKNWPGYFVTVPQHGEGIGMAIHLDATRLQEIQTLLSSYFPDCGMIKNSAELLTEDNTNILYRPEQILPYLQTVFFAEHLLELQIDQSTRIFFANILDDLPDLVEHDQDDRMLLVEPDYEIGSYLKSFDSLVLTPLTPGVGNVRVRSSQQIIVRCFSGTTAIEFGCTFRQTDVVRDTPVLRFDFPVIGRINKNYRSFRVKALSTIDSRIVLKKSSATPSAENCYQVVDVSAMGLAFQVPSEQQPFDLGQMIHFSIQVPDINSLEVRGHIRHISKVRDTKGYKNICGVQFDLETRFLAAEIEKVAAAIQRLQLRELAEKTANLDGVRLVR